MFLEKASKVLITGTTGMVGSALERSLSKYSHLTLLKPTRKQLDLLNADAVDSYFNQHRPDYVFMLAAKVGGIIANKSDPVGFLTDNARIQLNLFEACHKYQTKKNLFLGSSCIYPRECPQPMKEEYLMTGLLEPTNEGYAIAKIMGLKLAKYYYEQYGMLTVCPMPCNIYGTNDHFDLDKSHVLSALVKRFLDAKDENKSCVTLWGTGEAKREFIHVDDVARALVFLMSYLDSPDIINLGTGKDISIKELAELIASQVNYSGEINWDTTKPDGMPRKCLDISRITTMGFENQVDLKSGIARMVVEYSQLKLENIVR
jgi:GDP-L-fucose synthase